MSYLRAGYHILGCDASLPTFRRNVLPPYSWPISAPGKLQQNLFLDCSNAFSTVKIRGSTFLQNSGKTVLPYTESQAGGQLPPLEPHISYPTTPTVYSVEWHDECRIILSWKGSGRDLLWDTILPSAWGTEENHEQDSRCLNRESPGWESEVLPLS
jgi:hypothetical protein